MLSRLRDRIAAHTPERLRGLAAAVVHGELTAPALDWLRQRRAQPPAGTVAFGSALRPAAALIVTDFDAHAHAAATLDAVTTALSDAGHAFVCSPDRSGHLVRQVVVDAADAGAVATTLARSLDAPGWCAQPLVGGRPVGQPVPLEESQIGAWLRSGGARLLQALAAPQGTVLGGSALGCDLQAWRRVETDTPRDDEGTFTAGTRIAPDTNGWAPYLPAASWDEADAHPSHVPSVLRAPDVFAVTEPVDVVFTWVDSSDSRWQHARDQALATAGQHHPSATDRARFDSADELRYAMRSVHYYASWVRRIHLVTAGQIPAWLDPSDPRIAVVDHTTIFPTGSVRVFNSHAIESRLHHIPDLSEHYLYLNDDVMFGRPVLPEDFYVGNQLLRFGIANHLLDPSPATALDPAIMAAGKNGRELLIERFGRSVHAKVRHGAHPQLRSVAEQIEREHPDAFNQLARSVFRSSTDLSVAASLQMWYAAALGRAVAGEVDLLYLDIESEAAPRVLHALLRTRQHQVMCLNVTRSGPDRDQALARLHDFLVQYFPLAAPWERDRPQS